MATKTRKRKLTVRIDGHILKSYEIKSSQTAAFKRHMELFFVDEKTAYDRLRRLLNKVAKAYGVAPEELTSRYPKGHDVKEAIKLMAYIAVNDLMYDRKIVVDVLGITHQQVKRAIETIEVRLRYYPDLREKYEYAKQIDQ